MSKRSAAWDAACLHWRGKVLTGKHGHWCPDWDDLPIDETCIEWPCICFRTDGKKRGFHAPVRDEDVDAWAK